MSIFFTIEDADFTEGSEIRISDPDNNQQGYCVLKRTEDIVFCQADISYNNGLSIGDVLTVSIWNGSSETILYDNQFYPFTPNNYFQKLDLPLTFNTNTTGNFYHVKIVNNTACSPEYSHSFDQSLLWNIIPAQDDSNQTVYVTCKDADCYTTTENPSSLDNKSFINNGTTFSWDITSNSDQENRLSYEFCLDSKCYTPTTEKSFTPPFIKEDGKMHTWQIFTIDYTKTAGPIWTFTSYYNEPPVAVQKSYTTNEDQPMTDSLEAINETQKIWFDFKDKQFLISYEKDEKNKLSYFISNEPEHGTITYNSQTGEFFYTPDTNFDDIDYFEFYAEDDFHKSTKQTVSLHVTSVCDPVMNIEPPGITGSFFVGETLYADEGKWDTDESGDISYDIEWQQMDNNTGFTIANGRTFVIDKKYAHKNLRIKVTGTNCCRFSKTIYTASKLIENTPPVFENISPIVVTIDEDSSITTVVLQTCDKDIDPLIWSHTLNEKPFIGSMDDHQYTATLSFRPEFNFFGTEIIDVSVNDPFEGSATIPIQVTVISVNDAPLFEIDDNNNATIYRSIDEDSTAPMPISNISPGADNEYESLSFSVRSNSSDITPTIDWIDGHTSGQLFFELTPDYWNNYTEIMISLSETQPGGLSTTKILNLKILPINDPPVCTTIPSYTGNMYVGETLIAEPGIWNDLKDDQPVVDQFVFQWQRSDTENGHYTDINNAMNDQYTLSTEDSHHFIRVKVIATDKGEPGQITNVAFSNARQVLNSAPVLKNCIQIMPIINAKPTMRIGWQSALLDGQSLTNDDEIYVYSSKTGNLCGMTGIDHQKDYGELAIYCSDLVPNEILLFKIWQKEKNTVVTLSEDMFEPTTFRIYLTFYSKMFIPFPYQYPIMIPESEEKFFGLNIDAHSYTPTLITVMDEDASPVPFIQPLFDITDKDADSLTWMVSQPVNGGTAFVNQNSYSPTIHYSPKAHFYGKDEFELSVSDGFDSDHIRILVYIQPQNDYPVKENLPEISGIKHINEKLTSVNSQWKDSHDSNEILTCENSLCTYQWQKKLIDQENAINISGATDIAYTPDINDEPYLIRVKVVVTDDKIPEEYDQNGVAGEWHPLTTSMVSNWISLTNDPPEIIRSGPVTYTTIEDTRCQYTIPNISAIDINSDKILWHIKTQANNGVVRILNQSAETPEVCYTPNENFFGNDTYIIQAVDIPGLTDSTRITIVVLPSNDPPQCTKKPELKTDSELTYFHVGDTIQVNNGQWNDDIDCQWDHHFQNHITFSYQYMIADNEKGHNRSILNDIHDSHYTLDFSHHNKYICVTVTASDTGIGNPNNLSTSESSIWYPIINKAPKINQGEKLSYTILEDTVFQIDQPIEAIDPETDGLFWKITKQCQHGSVFMSSTNPVSITYTPDNHWNGTDDIVLTVYDYFEFQSQTLGGTDAITLVITVLPVDDPPYVTSNAITEIRVEEDTNCTFVDLSGIFSDLDNKNEDIHIDPLFNHSSFVLFIDNENISCDKTLLSSAETRAHSLTLCFNHFDILNIEDYAKEQLTLNAISNGLTVLHHINIIMEGKDDPPEVIESNLGDEEGQISLKKVMEDAEEQCVSIKELFTDIDNDDAFIELSIFDYDEIRVNAKIKDEENLCVTYVKDQNKLADITVMATSNQLTSTHTFYHLIKPVDDPPIVLNPITERIVLEDAPPLCLNLSDVFFDIDLDKDSYSNNVYTNADHIIKEIMSNSNPGLITSYLSDNNSLKLEFNSNVSGFAEICLKGTSEATSTDCSGSYSITHCFHVKVDPVDDPPYPASPVPDKSYTEDNRSVSINLSNVFSDIDNDDVFITKTLLSVTNYTIVTSRLEGNHLRLSFSDDLMENEIATSDITIQALSNGLTANDSFSITITGVDDKPVVVDEIEDITKVVGKEEIGDTTIDLKLKFSDIDNNNKEIEESVLNNSNSAIVKAYVWKHILRIQYLVRIEDPGYTEIQKATITLQAKSNGKTCTDTFLITIIPFDDPPEIKTPLTDVSFHEDYTPVHIDLSHTFTDIDNDDTLITKKIVANSNPTIVSTTISENSLTLCFLKNQHGTAEIAVMAVSNGLTVTDHFKLSLTAVDDPPEAINPVKDIRVDEDAEDMTIDISEVFTDVDNDDSAIKKELQFNSTPSLVTAFVLDNELLHLSFKAEKSGIAQISVLATSNTLTAVNTFTLTVLAVDDPPDLNELIEDVFVDEDADNTIIQLEKTFTDRDNDDNEITKTIFSNSKESLVHAWIKDNTLTLDYQKDQYGEATITVEGNSNGLTQIDQFNVTVNAVDDPPIILKFLEDKTVDEDSGDMTIDLNEFFTDVDNDDSEITKSLRSNSNTSLITASVLANDLNVLLHADQHGTAQISIMATSNGLTVVDAFSLTVNAVDDPPDLNESIKDVFVDEDADNTIIQLEKTFTDRDNDDNGIIKTIFSNSKESLVHAWIKDNTLTLDYQEDQSGKAVITVEGNSKGLTQTDQFNVTVKAVDDPPEVNNPIKNIKVNEDTKDMFVSIDDVFTDVDNSDTAILKEISLNTNQSLISVNVLDNNELKLSFHADQNGIATISVLATSHTLTAVNTFTLTVLAVDDPPDVNELIEDVTVNEDADNTIIQLDHTFTDRDNDDNKITKTIFSNSNESLVVASIDKNKLTLDYQENQHGQATIIIEAHSNKLTTTDSFNIKVDSVNDPPIIATSNPIKVTMDEDGNTDPEAISWKQPEITVIHPDENDPITWHLFKPPSHGMTIVSPGGAIVYTPDENWNKNHKPIDKDDIFEILVSDSFGLTDTVELHVTVVPRNDPVVIGDVIVRSDLDNDKDKYVLTLIKKDLEDKWDFQKGSMQFEYAWYEAQDDLCFENARLIDGETEKEFIVDNTNEGKYYFAVLTVLNQNNGEGGPACVKTTKQSNCVLVKNQSPNIEKDEYDLEINEDNAIDLQKMGDIIATDLDSSDLTWTMEPDQHPHHGKAMVDGSGANPVIGYTPDKNWFGTDSFYITVTDSLGGLDRAKINIEVKSVNDPPSIDEVKSITITEDSGQQFIDLSGINAGPENENQELDIYVSSNNKHLISDSELDVISGQLRFKTEDDANSDANGDAIITIRLEDKDGVENGGINYYEESFTLNVLPINDRPSFEISTTEVTGYQASGENIILNVASNISPGALNENDQLLTFYTEVEDGKSSLFKKLPEIRKDGTLSFTPSDSNYGEANVTVNLFDGIDYDSYNSSEFQQVTIKIQSNEKFYINSDIALESKNYERSKSISIPIFLVGGHAPFTPTITGALPTGLDIRKKGQIPGEFELAGEFKKAGHFGFIINFTDSDTPNNSTWKKFYMKVADTLKIDSEDEFKYEEALKTQIQGKALHIAFHAEGGDSPYTFSFDDDFTDVFSITKTDSRVKISMDSENAYGNYTITVKVTDKLGRQTTKDYLLTFVPPIVVQTKSLNHYIMGEYRETVFSNPSGGYTDNYPYEWFLSQSTILPEGLSFDRQGKLYGTPTQAIHTKISFWATDRHGHHSAETQLTLIVSKKLEFKKRPLPSGKIGENYQAIIEMEGGFGNLYYEITDQPIWFNFTIDSSTGRITGTPKGSGTGNITIKVHDRSNPVMEALYPFHVLISEKVMIEPKNLPNAREGKQLSDDATYQFTSKGCDDGEKWSIDPIYLPNGISFDTLEGKLFGTPTRGDTFEQSIAGDYEINVQLTCNSSDKRYTATGIFPWTIIESLKCNTTYLPDAIQGQPYQYTLTASGGESEDYDWGATSIGYLKLSRDGILSCDNPKQSIDITIFVRDGVDTSSKTLSFNVLSENLTLTPLFNPIAKLNCPYKSWVNVKPDDLDNYSWNDQELESFTIPGLEFSHNETKTILLLSGKPAKTGTYDFYVKVVNANAASVVSKWFHIDVKDQLKFNIGDLDIAIPGEQYNELIRAEGGIPPYHYRIIGDLPSGLISMAEDNSVRITGTVQKNAQHSYFTIEVKDSTDYSELVRDNGLIVVQTDPYPYIVTLKIKEGKQFFNYEQEIVGEGGWYPYRWSIDETYPLPDGLSLETKDNKAIITGIPSECGDDLTFKIRLTDNQEQTTNHLFQLKIDPNLIINESSQPLLAKQYCYYSTVFTAKGGDTPYTWTVEGLPIGFNSKTYDNQFIISGSVDKSKIYSNIVLNVMNKNNLKAEKTIMLTVEPYKFDLSDVIHILNIQSGFDEYSLDKNVSLFNDQPYLKNAIMIMNQMANGQ